MGIRIGNYLKKDHKFSSHKLLKAMKLSGMLNEDTSYHFKKLNFYHVDTFERKFKTKMDIKKSGSNNNEQIKAA